MPRKKQQAGAELVVSDVVVARSGDRTFHTPSICSFVTVTEKWELSAEVAVVDRRPLFRDVHIRCREPFTPLEMQRFPWARAAEWALEANARETDGRRASGSDVRTARTKARRAAARGERDVAPDVARRNRVTPERLAHVVALHDEAQAAGIRWDQHASERLGCSEEHARKLYSRARREGI